MKWNPSRTFPTEVGEYHAVLEPYEACSSMRRYWNGKFWSDSYSILWPHHIAEKFKNTPSAFQPAWLSKEDTEKLSIRKY